jgi:hypothetical protein
MTTRILIIAIILGLVASAGALTTKSKQGSSFLYDTATDRICGVVQPDGTPDFFAFVSPYSAAGAPTNGVQATLTTDMTNVNADVTLTSVGYGAVYNQITIAYLDPGANSIPLHVGVNGTDIKVTCATDGTGAITTTGAEVVAALNANAEIAALVTATDEGDGSGVINAVAKAILAGGVTATPGIVGITQYLNTTTGVIYVKSNAYTWAALTPTITSVRATVAGSAVAFSSTSSEIVAISKIYAYADGASVPLPAVGAVNHVYMTGATGKRSLVAIFSTGSTLEIAVEP